MSEKLKRAVIKEELVVLTGGFVEALILDTLLRETHKIRNLTGEEEVWIDKTAEEFSEQLMLGMSKQTIRRYIFRLIKAGYITERNNPYNSHDRTKQYRVNTDRILQGLMIQGYTAMDALLSEEGC